MSYADYLALAYYYINSLVLDSAIHCDLSILRSCFSEYLTEISSKFKLYLIFFFVHRAICLRYKLVGRYSKHLQGALFYESNRCYEVLLN